jgi:tetratricopeptide (TPR) repeat protein
MSAKCTGIGGNNGMGWFFFQMMWCLCGPFYSSFSPGRPCSIFSIDLFFFFSRSSSLLSSAHREGNNFFKTGDYKHAIEKYTEAIQLDPSNHTYWSNRS